MRVGEGKDGSRQKNHSYIFLIENEDGTNVLLLLLLAESSDSFHYGHFTMK